MQNPAKWRGFAAVQAVRRAAAEKRVERLKAFWEGISARSSPWPALSCMTMSGHRRTSSINALMFGQPGFFAPRSPMRWLLGAKPTSY
jgi:NTE family protein